MALSRSGMDRPDGAGEAAQREILVRPPRMVWAGWQMDPSNPYAMLAAETVKERLTLNDLDLAKLPAQQRKFLELAYSKPNGLCWFQALFMAGVNGTALIDALIRGTWNGVMIISVAIHVTGYLGFGYWARNWSRLAAFMLLGWHVLVYYDRIHQHGVGPQLILWLPALLIFFGYLGARSKVVLTQRAMPDAIAPQKPMLQPHGKPVRVFDPVTPRQGPPPSAVKPVFRPPGEVSDPRR